MQKSNKYSIEWVHFRMQNCPPEVRFKVVSYTRDMLVLNTKFNSMIMQTIVYRTSSKSYHALIQNYTDCVELSARSSEQLVNKICEVLKYGI